MSAKRAKAPNRKPKKASQAAPEPEPEELTSALLDFEPTFADFSLSDQVRAQADEFVQARAQAGEALCGPRLGRVIRLDRGYPLIETQEGPVRAEHAISLVKDRFRDFRAAVGDWVVLDTPEGHDKAVIETVLPRATQLSRWDGGTWGARQMLATNVDAMLVAQPLSGRDLVCDRLVRSVVLAHQGGIAPCVLLTKADRAGGEERLQALVEQTRRAVGPGVPVVAVSVPEGRGVEQVRSLIVEGRCAVLLGESGAGKSTLVNALAGAEVLGVGEVRGRDDQGRHTTVARRMVKVPGAGVLVDAPGLRSLPLLDEEAGLAATFPEIDGLLGGCRFRDCTHGNEPGCAVLEGVRTGGVDASRLEEYRMLVGEMLANRRGLDPAAKASLTK
jgi:ribosome biogenesis GTPase / thiamine phosphate phosphatase